MLVAVLFHRVVGGEEHFLGRLEGDEEHFLGRLEGGDEHFMGRLEGGEEHFLSRLKGGKELFMGPLDGGRTSTALHPPSAAAEIRARQFREAWRSVARRRSCEREGSTTVAETRAKR